ncbi:inositol monophosphatase family protein [Cohnella sp. REN36]|uniref:inositol monophosphatase family protein n=1 Tax=Cohnella sp. REN36 TaxID=2887347 RepID=UPI001D13710A|nr:inositol monophosphatase family protein [Cohnella sp. REN36]MCC3372565.1 inositol monophosphatase [Cohnella sp. REN36]
MNLNQEESYGKTLLGSAVRYAMEAGEQILSRMSAPYRVGDKVNRADLVTDVDLHSERVIRERIGRDYPDHWILSEETDGGLDAFGMMARPAPGIGWIIDPIDGTINFVHGIPHFAVSIGIVRDGSLLHGVVFNPVTRELFHATHGEGARLNGDPIRVGAEADVGRALLATGFQASDWRRDSVAAAQVSRIAGISRSVRILGAASLDLCMIACGRLNGFWHDGLYPWDVAAGLLIVREAGGTVSNGEGDPYVWSDKKLVASSPELHGELLALLFTED